MTGFTNSPRLIKGGIVILDPSTSAVQRVISLQYNPESLTRSLQVQGADGDGDRLEALRLKGPPIERISVDIEMDATDQLELRTAAESVREVGLQEQLAALETLLYPNSDKLIENNSLASRGTIEIMPQDAPLTVFVWNEKRVLPIRITEFTIVEEAFDTDLNPIRAKISLGMRVLSINDLPFDSKGGSLFMIHHQQKEQLMQNNLSTALGSLGIGRI